MDGRDVKIDAALTALSLAYKPQGLIADIVCPRVPVQKDSGKYYEFGSENLKHYDTVRAPKSPPNIATQSISSSSYQCVGHSLGDYIDDRDRERAPFNLEENTIETTMDKMLISLEKEVKTLFTTTGNYASAAHYTTLSGANQLDADGGGPNLEKLIDDAAGVIRTACGVAPNTLIIPWKVATVMKRMSQVQDQRKNVTDLTQQSGLPRSLWGYNIVIAGGIEDTAYEGQTKSLSDIWGDSMTLLYLNPSVNWKSMAFAKNFTLGENGFYVAREALPNHVMPYNAELIEVYENGRDPKIVGSSCAYLWQDCLAA